MNRRRRFKAKRRRRSRRIDQIVCASMGMSRQDFREMLEWADSRDGHLFLDDMPEMFAEMLASQREMPADEARILRDHAWELYDDGASSGG